MAKDDSPRNADFVGRVVSDAKNPPETRMLTGWLGDAADEGHRRLYTDADLSAYVDIPADAILHTEAIHDVQPSGSVFVWVKRDAALKPGGSASSRAARFLQGQIQQDFASGGGAAAGPSGGQFAKDPEKAGFRCVTQAPCGEPTGFTGQCTEQPVVGGAWPCVTAIPHCFEPTGFTGRCTHQPWPNPTQYIGCTFLHCPTQDLTHIPQICHMVATGLPGCPDVGPRGGEIDPAAQRAVAEAGGEGAAAQAERVAVPATRISACAYTRAWGLCETHLLDCGFTQQRAQCQTHLIRCTERKDFPTAVPGCGWSNNPICTDLPGCGYTRPWGLCQQTHPPRCGVSVDIPCITHDLACRAGVPGGEGPFAAFAAAAGGPGARVIGATQSVQCNPSIIDLCQATQPVPCNLTMVDLCPTRLCATKPPTALCTQLAEACPPTGIPDTCPTWCGPQCQTQQQACTASPPCTQAGPQCPTVAAAACPTSPQFDCTFGCTQVGPTCPIGTQQPACITPQGALAAAARLRPTIWTQFGPHCPPTHLLGCTHGGPQCITYPSGDCTFFGGCPPTPATVCTQFAPCPTHQPPCTQQGPQCYTKQFECTMFCTHVGPECPPLTRTFQCGGGPSAVDACPTRLCAGGR
jgi:hypothetical protein